MYACVLARTRACKHSLAVFMYVYVRARGLVFQCVGLSVCVRACACVRARLCVCVRACVRASVFVCV